MMHKTILHCENAQNYFKRNLTPDVFSLYDVLVGQELWRLLAKLDTLTMPSPSNG
jgi:hypothetical protein